MIAVLAFWLSAAAILALFGYVRVAYSDFGEREQMPFLLIAFVLAIGFLALALK